jgi:hypothetical protein
MYHHDYGYFDGVALNLQITLGSIQNPAFNPPINSQELLCTVVPIYK